MGTALRIRQSVVDDLFAHAREEFPNECCGLLIGAPGLLTRAVRARNVWASPTRYLIDPADHFAAIRAARAEGLSVLGAYHSHPASGPAPSDTDIAEATSPSFVYLIVSPGGEVPGAVRAFYLASGQAYPIELAAVR